MAVRWKWVWGDDGGVLVPMHGNVLGRVGPAGVRVLCGPQEGAARGPRWLRRASRPFALHLSRSRPPWSRA